MAETDRTSVKEPQTRRVVVRVPRELHRALRLRAVNDDTTVADIARGLLAQYVREARS